MNLLKPTSISGFLAYFSGGGINPLVVPSVTRFDEISTTNACKRIYGSNWKIVEREAISECFFRKLIPFGGIIRLLFRPIVINTPATSDRATIYAPNHIKTVDPVILESVLRTHIHWVALKRFFDGRDSIFNNSKNPILCKITKKLFTKLDYFPVERKQDNDRANNFKSIKEMYRFLINGFNVGIFPEGTTRKENGHFFGNIDKGFAELAVKSNAVVQPILIYWAKHPIIHFGKSIESKGKNSEDILEEYTTIQHNSLSLCRDYYEKGLDKCRKRRKT